MNGRTPSHQKRVDEKNAAIIARLRGGRKVVEVERIEPARKPEVQGPQRPGAYLCRRCGRLGDTRMVIDHMHPRCAARERAGD